MLMVLVRALLCGRWFASFAREGVGLIATVEGEVRW
jgi:hypothetical protein